MHGRLGLPKSCAALDIALGCSGYVYGLWLTHSLIASGASRKILLLAGDTPSLHTDRSNRLVNPLFGDAGTATLLSWIEDERSASFVLGSDGTGWRHITIPGGGFRLPLDAEMLAQEYMYATGNPWKLTDALLNGMAVFDFTLHEVPPSIKEVLCLAGLSAGDIDFFALHQANKQIVQAIGTALGVSADTIYWETFSRYGNQSTASVPCVLCDALVDRMGASALTVLLSGFGVGLSWASAVIRFECAFNGGIQLYHGSDTIPTREEQVATWKKLFLGEPAS